MPDGVQWPTGFDARISRYLITPQQTGTLIDGTIRTPRIGIWLMPDNEAPGELEDFVAEMIPDDDPIWPQSKRYIDCIPEGDRRFTEKKTQRARIHAWLATREDPRQMGAAIGAGDLRVEGRLSTDFAEWLRKAVWIIGGTALHPAERIAKDTWGRIERCHANSRPG